MHRRNNLWAVGFVVWCAAYFLAVCVAVPVFVGSHNPVELGMLIANVLSAVGTFSAAAAAVWVATSDRRARRDENRQDHQDAAKTQARLVVIQPFLLQGQVCAAVNNFGSQPILDVLLIGLHVEGYDGPETTSGRTTIPAIPAGEYRTVSRRFQNNLDSARVTVRIQFMDARSNWWEVAFSGTARFGDRDARGYSTRRVAFNQLEPEFGQSRLPGGSRWEATLDGLRNAKLSNASQTNE